jgi:hypothetical protein
MRRAPRSPRHSRKLSRHLEPLESRVLLTGSIDSAFSFGSTSATEDRVTGMVVDSSGNIYITGHFSGTVDMDPGAGTTNLISNSGSQDIFVAAYAKDDTAGNRLLWAKSFGGALDEAGGDLTLANGALVVTGQFRGTMDADPGAAVVSLTSAGLSDVFFTRFNTNGDFVWNKTIGGLGTDTAFRIKSDSLGNVFIAGSHDQTIDFNPSPLESMTHSPSSPGGDLYILKLDSSGNFVWANTYYYSDKLTIANMTLDSSNNLYFAGTLRGGADLDGTAGTAPTLVVPTYVGYVAKIANNGSYLFSKLFGDSQVGASDTVNVYDVAVDSGNSIILVGDFGGTVDMDPSSATHTLTETQSPNAFTGFMLKLDASGAYTWAGALTGNSWSDIWAVTTDSSNNIYIGGEFRGTADFNIKSGTDFMSLGVVETAFVAKYDSLGNFVWGLHPSAASASSYVTRLFLGPDSTVIAAGYFSGTITFPTPTPTTFSPSTQDNFVIRIKQAFETPSAQLTVTPATALVGGPVTISITLNVTRGVPSGNVMFADSIAGTLGSVAVDATGKASITVNSLGVGTHNFSAIYTGDSNFTPTLGAGKSVNVIVNHAPTGNIDSTKGGMIIGWTADIDDKNTPLVIQMWIDGKLRGNVKAELLRADLQAAIGATNHGFVFQLPPIDAGTHTIQLITYDPLTGSAVVIGTTQMLTYSLFFDEAWYLRTYADVAAAVASGSIGSGWIHYSTRGAKEGRNPSAYFDEMWYRSKYSDVGSAITAGQLASGFAHFVIAGSAEGRDPSLYFNEMYYRRAYSDIGTAVTNGQLASGFTHFMLAGLMEGRSPTPWFDTATYLNTYADVKAAIATGLVRTAMDHFAERGVSEKRIPGPYFSEANYLAANTDIASAVTAHTLASGLAHFVRVGFYEGRLSYAAFDASWYRSQHAEVDTMITEGKVKSAFHHFLLYGRLQGYAAHA